MFVLVAIVCPPTDIVNLTQQWNPIDVKSLQSATKRCNNIYLRSPCLAKFIKKEENVYNAMCGPEATVRSENIFDNIIEREKR